MNRLGFIVLSRSLSIYAHVHYMYILVSVLCVLIRLDSLSAEHLRRDDLPAAVVGGRAGGHHDGHRHHPAVSRRHHHHHSVHVGHLHQRRGQGR